MKRALAAAVAIALAVFSLPARAEDPDVAVDGDEAAAGREAFIVGAALARQGQWTDALEAFQRLTRLRPHPVTTYNVGFCERALGRLTRARRSFGAALADHGAKLGGELPENLERGARAYVEEIDRKLSRARVVLTPAEAALSIDGRPLEAAVVDGATTFVAGTRDPGPPERIPSARADLVVDPGAHVIVVARPGRDDLVLHRTFAPAETIELTLDASAPTAALPRPAPARLAAPGLGEAPAGKPSAAGLVAAGIGGAGIVVSAITGTLFYTGRAELEAACVDNRCPNDREDQIATTNALGTTALIGLGIGAAGLSLGAFLLLRAPPPGTAASAKVPRRVSPWIGDRSAGVSGAF